MAVTPNDPDVLRQVVVEVKPHLPDRGVVSWWDSDTVLRIELDDKPERSYREVQQD